MSKDSQSPSRDHTRSRLPTSIADLPCEVLLDIFTLVFAFSLVRTRYPKATERATSKSIHQLWRDQDPQDPALFPYAVASVCRTWKSVASMCPAFWTRIVSFVDAEWEPASVEEQLAWSMNLPFRLTLMRRGPSAHAREAERVGSAIQALGPHLARCLQLEVHAFYSSSLPSWTKDLSGAAPILQSLRLTCQQDDGRRTVIEWPSHCMVKYQVTHKDCLGIDAWNFLGASICDGRRLRGFRRLHISHFSAARRNGQGFPMHIFLHAIAQMPDLKVLRVEYVDFAPLSGNAEPAISFPVSLISVHLKALSGSALGDLFGMVDYEPLDNLCIEGCSLAQVADVNIPSSECLELRDIHDVTPDLETFLRAWNGALLTIYNSPVLLNAALRVMATRDDTQPGSPFYCNRLRQFFISSSTALDIDALIHLVDRRNSQFLRYSKTGDVIFPGEFELPGAFVRGIHVAGCGVQLDAESAAWLRKHLPGFSWALGRDWVFP